MKTFLICPVRGKSKSDTESVVSGLESNGFNVHWPHRDTNQNDNIGIEICNKNLSAIHEADVVHVVWDGISQGCLFDLGMAFALGKKIIPISLPDNPESKSFQNMVLEWARR